MRGIGLKPRIAELVADQQLGCGEGAEALLEAALGMRLAELHLSDGGL